MKQGSLRSVVSRIGAIVRWTPVFTALEVPHQKVQELLEETRTLLSRHVVPLRAVRSVAGKVFFFAGIITYFLDRP
jgi:hypothetical protein